MTYASRSRVLPISLLRVSGCPLKTHSEGMEPSSSSTSASVEDRMASDAFNVGVAIYSPAEVAICLGATAAAGLFATDFFIACMILRAVKPAPNANLITGPKLFAAATPTKYRSGTDDSKLELRTGDPS